MDDELKVGIIGVGQVGKRHVERYQQLSGVEIVAVADIDQAEATRVAEINEVPRAFTDFRDLLALDEIRAVDVCLHNNLHWMKSAPLTCVCIITCTPRSVLRPWKQASTSSAKNRSLAPIATR
jgi:predicted homoserine dehydrogenase-like protein